MPRYAIPLGTNVSLSAATAKTVAAFSVNSTRRRRLLGFELGFDSIDAEHNTVLYEIIRTDGNAAGTATSRTPVPLDGADAAALCSGFVNYTAEPTSVTVVREGRITPVGGGIIYPFEFLDAIVAGVANALLGLRLTAAQAQSNIRGTLTYEE